MDDQLQTQVKSFVDQLAGWVKTQGGQQQDRAGASKWLVGLGVATVALIGIALLYWRSWKQGMKLAALEHAKAVSEQEKEMSKALQVVKGNEHKVEELQKAVKTAEDRIVLIDEQITAAQTQKAKALNEIENLKSWRDVDAHLGGGTPPASGGGPT